MVINADDFGYSASVNRAVCACFEKGLINRTTLLVNMPHTQEAAGLARRHHFFDKVGLHLNLTEGRALSEICARSELCDANGFFKGTFHIPFAARLYLPPSIRRAIYAEAEAQIQAFLALGFPLRHIDSHNYVHSYFSVYWAVQKLLQQYGFTSVRISRNVSDTPFSLPVRLYKGMFNALLRRLQTARGRVACSAHFGSVQDFEACADQASIKDGIELMTHPDFIDGKLVDNTLPAPHPFVSREWIKSHALHLEDVSGKKTKLLVCFIHAHIGGAMTSLVNFLNALDTEKYDVDVLFYEKGPQRYGIKEEINILPQAKTHQAHSVGNVIKKACSIPYVWAFVRDVYYKTVRHNKRKAVQIMSKQGCRYSRKLHTVYDAAIAYEFNWCMHYVISRVEAKKKLVWNHVEYEKSGMDFRIDKKALQKADALVFVSTACMERYVHNHPEHRQKAYFMPNLLSAEYVQQQGRQPIDSPFPNGSTGVRFLTVARIRFEHKGLDRAVMAFSRLKKEGYAFQWLIIGDGRDMPRLREMIAEQGLQDRVYPIGMRENPLPYYTICDAFLLPSRHEGKPIVITESLMMGLVPLVTAYTSAREQIRDGVDGLVFDNNGRALYQGLKTVLERPERLEELKQTILQTNYGNEADIAIFDEIVEKI